MKKSFNDICHDFFPKWRGWKIRRTARKASWQGYCDRERKEILIRHIPTLRESLYCLIIHECCHAVTDDYHGTRFQQRMLKASREAYEMGELILGNMILHDVKRIKKANTKGA